MPAKHASKEDEQKGISSVPDSWEDHFLKRGGGGKGRPLIAIESVLDKRTYRMADSKTNHFITERQAMTEQEMLLEQYKLYIEMTDRVSDRRAQTNKFYISLLSGILAILSIAVDKQVFAPQQSLVFVAVSLLGIGLNILWFINIRSFRQLSTGRFKVIHELEQKLPYAIYDREWHFLGEGKKSGLYLQLTRVEQFLPFILAVPYVLLFLYFVT